MEAPRPAAGTGLTPVGDHLDLADPATRAEVSERLGSLYAGRPVIIGVGVLAMATEPVRWLRALGCPVLVVCTTRGAGPWPPDDAAEVVEIPAPAAAMVTEEMRGHDRMLRQLPQRARDAVERFDPERRALWLTTPFVTSDEPILGRPVTGGRTAAALALEDKLLAEQVWQAAAVPAAPHRVVPVDRRALAEATAEVGGPLGAVWSGDTREGFNGGGDFVRWVDVPADQGGAFAFFAARCDQVRVMPFLDGVPCSIHGLVLPDGTATFRPVEIAMLRDPTTHTFLSAGLGTFWDPSVDDRDEMRGVARRVGAHLATAYSYRGGFGIDGVLTADGFRPTELNSRMSAGLTVLATLDPHLVSLLHLALVAGRDPGLSVAEVESLVPAMDLHRVGRLQLLLPRLEVEARELDVTHDAGGVRRASAPTGETVSIAPTATGAFVRLTPAAFLAPGDRLATAGAALARLVEREYDVDLGALEAAPDVRRPRDG
jgi:hypothetical protein